MSWRVLQVDLFSHSFWNIQGFLWELMSWRGLKALLSINERTTEQYQKQNAELYVVAVARHQQCKADWKRRSDFRRADSALLYCNSSGWTHFKQQLDMIEVILFTCQPVSHINNIYQHRKCTSFQWLVLWYNNYCNILII